MTTGKHESLLHDFFIEAALYAKRKLALDDLMVLFGHPEVNFDGYCPYCREKSTFTVAKIYIDRLDSSAWFQLNKSFVRLVSVKCNRRSHILHFTLMRNDDSVQKIGQFPSLADINLEKLKDYKGVIDQENLAELKTAIGLAAHGVGVGSFVYLRRVFEGLIYKRYADKKNENNWSDDDFFKLRMNDKIVFLRNFLPDFLVENARIYSILSVGVHELQEAQCLAFFEPLKESIIIILEEDRKKREDEQRKEQFKKAIAQFKVEN